MVRIGINGFGRIGRQVLKAVLERHPQNLEVVAVNDLFDVETNANLFKYDTNYGRFPGEVKAGEDCLIVNGHTIKSFSFRDPATRSRAFHFAILPLFHGMRRAWI